MTTSRIAPLPPAKTSLLTRLMYRYAKRRFGEVPEPFAVAAHHPRLLLANAVHEGMLQSASKQLPANVRELAVFWTARTIGCSWCVDFGAMLQRLDGLDVERLRHIDDYATSPSYSDDERAAIAYADAMTTDPHGSPTNRSRICAPASGTPGSSSSATRSAWRTCGPGCTRGWESPSRASVPATRAGCPGRRDARAVTGRERNR